MEETLTRCLRVEIIKPLGEDTWDSVGPHMHVLRQCMASLLNEAVVECMCNPDVAPQSAAAVGIRRGMQELQAFHAKRLKAKNLPTDRRDWSARIVQLQLSSVTVDAMTGMVKGNFSKWRKSRFNGAGERIPSFTSELIPIRDKGWQLTFDGRGHRLSVKLHAGRGPWIDFAVKINGDGAHGLARLVERGGAGISQGDCKLIYDAKKKKWSARLAVSYPPPQVPAMDPKKAISIHRGIRKFITWATSDGDTGVIDNGAQIVMFKGAIHRRRRQWYSLKKSPWARSRGRGWYRRYENYRALEDREAKFVKTKCQQVAAEIVRIARKKGCGTILLDDWSARKLADDIEVKKGDDFWATFVRNWPFAQTRDMIVNAAKAVGMNVVTQAVAAESTRCPRCGYTNPANDRGRGRFCCQAGSMGLPECSYDRDIDFVANLNALHAAGYLDVLRKVQKKTAAFVRAAGRKREEKQSPVA